MFRTVLALGLIANSLLFGVGVWRSVLQGERAFHTLGEVGGITGWLGSIWIWPLTLVLLCLLLLLTRQQKPRPEHFDDG